MDNATAAAKLDRLASLLEAQRANPYRVDAWRAAAVKVAGAAEPVEALGEREGNPGLQRVLGIGDGVASALHELLATGRLRMLERLEGRVSPEDLFLSVPGVGPTLAGNVHTRLGIDTLEELELAAVDGRLAKVPGFGPRRISLVRDAVAGMLQHSMRRANRRVTPPGAALSTPSTETLLSIDSDYRAKAARGDLPLLAPVHFNPTHSAWLPVLHAEADGFHFTAMYSNSARAHRLGRTQDWVVIYFERDGHENQCTVVTETRGPRKGARVVRGDAGTPVESVYPLTASPPRAERESPAGGRQAQ
ncbi:MAG: DNA-binding protein [Archangiaceae bacterium]|nr:DNA-binding protein [Archangiaceae bacterium]